MASDSTNRGGRALVDTAEVAQDRREAAERVAALIEQRDALADDPAAATELQRIDAELEQAVAELSTR